MGALLRLRDVRVTFKTQDGPVDVLRGVNLSISPGECVALLGESGSGKSVTARTILGLLPERRALPTGECEFEGRDLFRLGKSERRAVRGRTISMIFQDPMAALSPAFTIRNQFKAVLKRAADSGATSGTNEDAMRAALKDVEIHDPDRVLDSYSFQLSGGLNQRVMIAMALISKPKLLIADEPGTALDVTIQHQTLKLMSQLSRVHGTAMLFISHNLGVVKNFTNRVCVMYAGAIVEDAPTEALFAQPQHPYTRALLNAVPKLWTRSLPPSISGAPPGATEKPVGCAFRPRCNQADARCIETPPTRQVGDRHLVACVASGAAH